MLKQIWIWLGLLALIACLGLGFQGLAFERLGTPLYLWGLLALWPLAWLARRGQRQGQQRLQTLFAEAILPRLGLQSLHSSVWRWGLSLVLVALVCVALARPQGGPVLTQSQTQGLDILVAFDISDSMQAADERPSRLEAAKQGVRDWLAQSSGDRIGMLVFAGEAFPLAPFTHDMDALSMLLDEVQPHLLDSRTTDLEEALKMAQSRFAQRRATEQSGQVLVVFSDGENQLGDYDRAAKALAEDGVVILTVGTGSEQGARIPERTLWGGMAYKTWQGQEVVSKRDTRILKKIVAHTPQGMYLPLKDMVRLPQHLDQLRGSLKTTASSQHELRQFDERYQAWLLLALLVLVIERSGSIWQAYLPRRPRLFPQVLQRVLHQQTAVVLLPLLPLLLGAWNWPWQDLWHRWRGEQAYTQQDYQGAQKQFEQGLTVQPDDPILRYNQGNSRYLSGDYDGAIESYQRGMAAPQITPEQEAQALYNLGNSYYRRGQQNPEQAREAWQKSVEAYQQALEKNRQDTQALENLNHVQEQLQQLPPQDGNQPPPDTPPDGDNQGEDETQTPPPQNGDNGNSGEGSPLPDKAEHSPLDGMFSDQEIQQYLEQLKQQEQQDRGRGFQRRPAQNKQDPFKMDDWLNGSQTKDW